MSRTRFALAALALLGAGNATGAFLDGNKLLEYCFARGGYGEGAGVRISTGTPGGPEPVRCGP